MSSRKRFWKVVSVIQDAKGLFVPQLDGRSIRLPKGTVIAVQSPALAEAVAAEWENIPEGREFSPENLPLTRIVGTFLERVSPDLTKAREELLRFGIDDELCYQKGEQNVVLRKVFEWLKINNINPNVTNGFMPVIHNEEYIASIKDFLKKYGAGELSALGVLVQVFGSLLLSLAVIDGVVTSEEALSLANSDEQKQMLVWGYDAELEKTIQLRKQDVNDALAFLEFEKII